MSLPFSPVHNSTTAMRLAFEDSVKSGPLSPLYTRVTRLLKSGSGRTRVPSWKAPSVSIRL